MPTDVDAGRTGLDLGDGWTRRWTVSWRAGGDDAPCSVHDLVQELVLTSASTRHFTWRRDPRHRPGLQLLTSPGRHHGAESLEESRVLLAPNFAGDVVDAVSQPQRISFGTCGKRHSHTTAYPAVTRRGVWLIDARHEPLLTAVHRKSFAAAARWREHAFAGLDATASAAPAEVRSAGASTGADRRGRERAARAQLPHLLRSWELGVDLAAPLADRSLVMPAGEASR